MQKYQRTLVGAIVLSETSHIFCCVLPTIFSILSLLGGFGLMVTVPGWMQNIHEVIHRWEMPMILFSMAIVGAGWGLHYCAKKMDCHDTGCCHGACAPKKDVSGRILGFATVLLVFNLLVYFVFHRHQDDIAAYVHAGHDHHVSAEELP